MTDAEPKETPYVSPFLAVIHLRHLSHAITNMKKVTQIFADMLTLSTYKYLLRLTDVLTEAIGNSRSHTSPLSKTT